MNEHGLSQDWRKPPLITVVNDAIKFVVLALKDVSTTIWIWLALFVLLQNIFAVAVTMLVGLFVFGIFFCALKRHFTEYRFTDHSVEIVSGILSRREVKIPFERVLNVEISQPWIFKFGDYVSASFDSAGTAKKDGLISGIKHSDAVQIKQIVLSFKDGSIVDQPLDVQTEDSTLLVHREWKDLFIFGMSHNRIFLFFGLIVGFYYKVKEVVKDLDSKITLYLEPLMPDGNMALYAMVVISILVFITLSAVGSGVLQIIQSYGYSLFKSDKDLSQSEGLFTKRNTHVQLKKLQWVIIRETVLDRIAKRCSVILSQMNNSMVVPALRRSESMMVINAIYPDLDFQGSEYKRGSFYRVFKTLIFICMPIGYLGYVALVDLSRYGFAVFFISSSVLVGAISVLVKHIR